MGRRKRRQERRTENSNTLRANGFQILEVFAVAQEELGGFGVPEEAREEVIRAIKNPSSVQVSLFVISKILLKR